MNTRKVIRWGIALTALAAAGAWVRTKRATSYTRLHPELRSPLLRVRQPAFTPTLVQLIRHLPVDFPTPADVHVESHRVPGPPGAPEVPVYVYRPHTQPKPAAALLFIHGGGYIIGAAQMFHAACARYVRELGIVVVSVDYRLAPDTPFPGPLEDCYAALRWIHAQADALGVDPARIAIAGESAGGGLAAALAHLAHDRGEVTPRFQLLLYPMLDDRTTLQAEHAGRGEFVWTPASNRLGWSAYLGREPVLEDAPEYAAPARRQNLAGLPPAWIGVGDLDLFYPENAAYAQRLREAGVPCEFYVVTGAYHAFEQLQPDASVAQAFLARSVAALHEALTKDASSDSRSWQ
ncbi:MAG: alpha/beta hydrolase [Caldilineaceae bacterium]|nr:alpha/beta hydrolase [Caldilinea sp.]MCB0068685.1 alpha/beta hydrolase [Caldilineaceae bacterium]